MFKQLWAPCGPVKLTSKINHQKNQVAILTKSTENPGNSMGHTMKLQKINKYLSIH